MAERSPALRPIDKIRWDDIEFKISKSSSGYDFHVGATPRKQAEVLYSRLMPIDYAIAGAAVLVVLAAIKTRRK